MTRPGTGTPAARIRRMERTVADVGEPALRLTPDQRAEADILTDRLGIRPGMTRGQVDAVLDTLDDTELDAIIAATGGW